MSGRVEWAPKLVIESGLPRYADFADELPSGVTLSSVATQKSVWSGNDPGATSLTIVASVINNSFGVATIAQILLTGGVLGTIYEVDVIGTTSTGAVITKTASLAIKPGLE